MNPVIEKLVMELDKAVNGDPWYGASLKFILRDITYKQAATRHDANIHTIAEIALHICAWIEEVSSRLEGNELKDPKRGDWPEVDNLNETSWKKIVEDILAAHETLIEQVKIFPFEKFEERVGTERVKELGTGFTYREMLVGVMEHNIYHGGQIGLLKKLV
ncbi:MAG: DinB family protein [Stygiobacter sp.]|nr:MAG: DinB family protein [Stygiobacter sp.]